MPLANEDGLPSKPFSSASYPPRWEFRCGGQEYMTSPSTPTISTAATTIGQIEPSRAPRAVTEHPNARAPHPHPHVSQGRRADPVQKGHISERPGTQLRPPDETPQAARIPRNHI